MLLLATLERDWDGEGALPISKTVINNLKRVLTISDDEDWKYWLISPAPNGSLGLQSKRHTASISIGDEVFSYYSETDNGEDWGDQNDFFPSVFLEVMRRIV